MNYSKIYQDLVKSRKQRDISREIGYELHHIIPKCMGGTNDPCNIVKFTYREHYLAHSLLSLIYPENVKIQYSFLCMLRDPHGYRTFTSKMYDTIKRRYSEFKKWHIKIVNPGKTKKSRDLARDRMTKSNPMIITPEKNHTAKQTIVVFSDGETKTYKIKKDFINFMVEKTGFAFSSLKTKIKSDEFLKQHGIISVVTVKYNEAKEVSLGKKWYTDGIQNLYLSTTETIPIGYRPGMAYKKRK